MFKSRVKLLIIGVLFFSAVGCASVQELVKDGRVEEAEKKCTKPKDYRLVGEAYLKRGDDQNAANCFAMAKDVNRLLMLGDGYLKNGEPDRAVFYYLGVVPIIPRGNADMVASRLAELGDIYMQKEALPQAARCYTAAIDQGWGKEQWQWGESANKARNAAEKKVKLADAFAARKDYENAAVWYKKAGYVEETIYWRLGKAYTANGDFNNAMINFKKAYAIEANERRGGNLAQMLRLEGEGYQAKGEYNKAADIYELLGLGYQLAELGNQRLAVGDIALAASFYDRAVKADRRLAESRQSLYVIVADAYLTKGDYAVAADYYGKAQNMEGIIKAGDAALAVGDQTSAVTYYQQARADRQLMRVALRSVKKVRVMIEQEYYGERRNLVKQEDATGFLSYCGLQVAAPDDLQYEAVISISVKGTPYSENYTVYGRVYSGASVDVAMKFDATLNEKAVSYETRASGSFSPPTAIRSVSATGPESAPFSKAVDAFLNNGVFSVLADLFGGAPLIAALRDPKIPSDFKHDIAIEVLSLRDNKCFEDLLSFVKNGPAQTRVAVLNALQWAAKANYGANIAKWKEWWYK